MLKSDVILRAMPYKVVSPQHEEPAVLVNEGVEMTPTEIFKSDLKKYRPEVTCVQIDPMRYSSFCAKVRKVQQKEHQNKDIKDDPDTVVKNNKYIDKIFDGMLHPMHGEGSTMNLKVVEMDFNAENPRLNLATPLEKFFTPELQSLVLKIRSGKSTPEEQELLNFKIESIRPLLDFAAENYHQYPGSSSPIPNSCHYHGIEEIYKQTFFSLMDVCLIEYPEPLARLFLNHNIKLDYKQAKEIYEGVIMYGESVSKNSVDLGFR